MAKRRVNCKLVRWREEHWNEPSEYGSGIGGVELIEDDQHCRILDWVLLSATLKMITCVLEGKLVGKVIKKKQVGKCRKS
jgi:hypothetical protein